MKILIPSIKKREELGDLINELLNTFDNPEQHEIITSGFPVSAATNRNYTLMQVALGEIVVMMDDDMTGFYPGWLEELVRPLSAGEGIVMVSARLLRPDGSLNIMLGSSYDITSEYEVVQHRVLPTACIAFRNQMVRFNENFVGSGFEDNRFCDMIALENPSRKFIINNKVQLVHLNEMKNQGGQNWELNKKYYQGISGANSVRLKAGPYVI